MEEPHRQEGLMPGAKSARMVMIVVAVIVVLGLMAAMLAAPAAIPSR